MKRVQIAVDMIRGALRAFSEEERTEILAELTREGVTLSTQGLDERALIAQALQATNYNISRAAKWLRISRRKLQTKMRAFGMPAGFAGRKLKALTTPDPLV